jgi:DnaJ-class molecular chaperone
MENISAKWDWEANERTEKTTYTKVKMEDVTRPKSVEGIQKSALDALALKWFRESAKKWHPDLCKGNSEPMKAVNDCYERLKELISQL